MLNVRIFDAYSRKGLKINSESEIPVVVHPHPPIDETVTSIPFRQFFTTDGTSSGSSDMRVNGVTTNVPFYIGSDNEKDIYIKKIVVILADASATLQKFGNLTALPNGVLFEWITSDLGTTTLFNGIKSNLDFFKLSNTKAEIIDLSGAGADAIIVLIDLADFFGNVYGLRLRKGSKDRLSFTVRDNLSAGIDEFNITGNGLKI